MVRWFAVSSCVLGLVACSASSELPPSSESFLSDPACTEVDEHAIEHACLHGAAGPFRSVTASTTAPPDVSRSHTAYRIKLEALPSGDFGGSLSFVPRVSGEYVIYTSTELPAIQLTQSGEGVALECSSPVPTDLCSSLTRVRVADLEAGAPVVFALEPSAASSVLLLIEELGHEH